MEGSSEKPMVRDRTQSIETHYDGLDSFVKLNEGSKVIRKVLISNNGISAVKAIRSIRRWAYMAFGNEREVEFVAMATPEDLLANAEYIRMADEVVDVPGGSNVNNYANVNVIVQLARRYAVDAVWAGWGHASENPLLPNTLEAHGIVFIGPPGPPMHALGDKIGSTIIAQSAKVPTIAWNGQHLTVNYKETNCIPKELYDQANVKTLEDCVEQVKKVGVPVMIKASEGGGGKGIRMVHDIENVPSAFRQVQGETPGSPIFVMKLAPKSRHLEVQLLCDMYGNAIALSGRDCSMQRRHQKILEEGPPIAAKPSVWKEMCEAAVRLAKEVGYINAGTVEYLYCEDKFYFLELNPRLQVEHPVTEMITGVNLPAAQLQVAMGVPLHRIADIRRLYGESIEGTSPIDFDNRSQVEPDGHVIAARITAENPYEGFQPTSGRIQELNFRSSRNVWGYFSVDSSGRVHEFADSQIGHIFAWGSTREHARRNMVIALTDLSIRGDIRTTIEYLKDMIESEDYKANNFDTSWLDNRIKANVVTVHIDQLTAVLVGAGVQSHLALQGAETEFVQALERGQLPPAALLNQSMSLDLIVTDTKYRLTCSRSGPNTYVISCNDSSVELEVRSLADGGFRVLCGGKSHVAYKKEEVGALRFTIDGQTVLFTEEYDPTQLRAQMGGKLLRYLVEHGEKVEKGAPFAEVEVMKMNMPLTAKESGTIHFAKSVGAVMEPGDLLCTMVLDDPSKVKRATVFEGKLPAVGEPWPEAHKSTPQHILVQGVSTLNHVMDGYNVTSEHVERALVNVASVVEDPRLPMLQVKDAFFFVKNSLPMQLADEISELIEKFSERAEASSLSTAQCNRLAQEFCSAISSCVQMHVAVAGDEGSAIESNTAEIVRIATCYEHGLTMNAMTIINNLLQQYLSVETRFAELELSDDAEKDDTMQVLRREYASDLKQVFVLALSHHAVAAKNATGLKLLQLIENYVHQEENRLSEDNTSASVREKAVAVLRDLAGLTGSSTSSVALEARQLLIELQEPSYKESLEAVEERLRQVASGDKEALHAFVHATEAVLHKLLDVVTNSNDNTLRGAAMEVYVRRVYQGYSINSLSVNSLDASNDKDGLYAEFVFHAEKQESLTSTMGLKATLGSFDDLSSLLSTQTNEPLTKENILSKFSTSSNSGFEDENTMIDDFVQQNQQDATMANFVGKNSDVAPNVNRKGVICFFSNMEALEAATPAIGELFASTEGRNEKGPVHVLHVMMPNSNDESKIVELDRAKQAIGEDKLADQLGAFMSKNAEVFDKSNVRRVTFAICSAHHGQLVSGHGSGFFTFRHRSNYKEDRIVRHIETPLAFQLDLSRLANFNISLVPLGKNSGVGQQTVHVYRALPKTARPGSTTGQRYFTRALIRQTARVQDVDVSNTDAYPGPERVFVQCLSALEAVQGNGTYKAGDFVNNHIFLNMLGDAPVTPEFVEAVIRRLYRRYARRLVHARVTEVELKVNAVLGAGRGTAAELKNAPRVPIRIIATNPTGYSLRVDTYVEGENARDPRQSVYYSISDSRDGGVHGALAAMGMAAHEDLDMETINGDGGLGELHNKPLDFPYPIISAFEEKRIRASLAGTSYVYDFPTLFRRASELAWSKYAKDRNGVDVPHASTLVRCVELVLPDDPDADKPMGIDTGLCTTNRPIGKNSIAMVAWEMVLVTPQYPQGRKVVVIANDITSSAGSFGTREDELFNRASRYARLQGQPRLYIAANSGARIGMADEVKSQFMIKWMDPSDESKGFDYVYLTEEGYRMLGPDGRNSVIAEQIVDHAVSPNPVYRVTTVIGEGRDLGVENLRGSGTIAGETSRAYEETFTLTYVSGRTVGIGAYLVRLGQRTIQKGKNAPILLTGYQALNSLMGKQVYTSNLQLGGPKVMYNNGVSHQCVRNDLEGVFASLNWLEYVPEFKGADLPLTRLVSGDTVDREVTYVPSKGEGRNPREMLTGITDVNGSWMSGFFDRGSFNEYLAGWAKTVIVGRARLGGIPMGVILSETRTVEASSPADPATPDSQERVWQQAGQVWFPDSAYKTSQAIRDFNNEGLPLMLFANWRGFSGGQRDMFDEVLKYGSFIVDALVSYTQPIFVYIPPYGELRGGAWVVVDPTINPDCMEMYAAPEGRGNVLEPAGAVSIKFRKKDLIKTAHRLDHKLKELDEQLRVARESDDATKVADLKTAISNREQTLLPVYHQVAIHFADLHDRPGRMQAKGVIRDVVPWVSSRRYFAWRLRRRLAEDKVTKMMASNDTVAAKEKAKNELAKLLDMAAVPLHDDREVYTWLDSTEGRTAVEYAFRAKRTSDIAEQVKNLGMEDSMAVLKGLMELVGQLSKDGKNEEREKLVQTLRRGVFVLGSGAHSSTT